MEQIGQRIRSARILRGKPSQIDFAAELGISRHRLGAIERGTSEIGALLLLRIAQTLDVSVLYLLGIREEIGRFEGT